MIENRFEIVYKNNIEALESFAFSLTRNKMDAEDLLQDAAIKFFRNFSSYNEDQNFRNWSFTILKNTYITNYNKRKRKKIIDIPVEKLHISSTIQVEQKSYVDKINLSVLRRAIENLSAKNKEPIKMFINGYSYIEISQYLGIPTGTVKSRINYARTKLRCFYQEAINKNFRLN